MLVEIIRPCRFAPIGAVIFVGPGVGETLIANGTGRLSDSTTPRSAPLPPIDAAPRVQAPQLRPVQPTPSTAVIRRPATIRKS